MKTTLNATHSIALLAGATGALALGASLLRTESQVFGKTIIAGSDPNEIALTFDDGPNPLATPQLLDILAEHQVRATFFMIGQCVLSYPAVARQVQAAGHTIGNHTMTHPRLTLLPEWRIRSELRDCTRALEDVSGAKVNLFRPPYGARRPAVLKIARDLSLTPVQWNVTGFDWGSADVEDVSANLRRGIQRNHLRGRGSNLLLHDGDHAGASRVPTFTATERLLLDCHGLRFVTPDLWS